MQQSDAEALLVNASARGGIFLPAWCSGDNWILGTVAFFWPRDCSCGERTAGGIEGVDFVADAYTRREGRKEGRGGGRVVCNVVSDFFYGYEVQLLKDHRSCGENGAGENKRPFRSVVL